MSRAVDTYMWYELGSQTEVMSCDNDHSYYSLSPSTQASLSESFHLYLENEARPQLGASPDISENESTFIPDLIHSSGLDCIADIHRDAEMNTQLILAANKSLEEVPSYIGMKSHFMTSSETAGIRCPDQKQPSTSNPVEQPQLRPKFPQSRSDLSTPVRVWYCTWEGCQYRGTFSRATTLKRHVEKIHINPKAHPCPYCEKRCNRADTLKQHLRDAHHLR